jgi:23S rRNA (guanosine2251-2'-O)-methyltransferase
MPTLEGRQSVLAAIEARQRSFQAVLIRRDTPAERTAEVVAAAEAAGIPVRLVERQELEGLTHSTSHGGVVALVSSKPRVTVDRLLESIARVRDPLLLLLEGVDDARNLGFVLRTAEAAGCSAVLIKKHVWDFDETEVTRPSSGAYERLMLVQIDDVRPLQTLQSRGLSLVGCLAGVRRSIWQLDLRSPTILALGGEKRGLSGAVRSICDGFATIPTAGGASSLSLSHATAILLGEALRQRVGSTARDGPEPTATPSSDDAEPGDD